MSEAWKAFVEAVIKADGRFLDALPAFYVFFDTTRPTVVLDGTFTADQLRDVADALDALDAKRQALPEGSRP